MRIRFHKTYINIRSPIFFPIKSLILIAFLFFTNCNNNKNKFIKTSSDRYIYMLSYNTNCNFSIFINDFLVYENHNVQGNQRGMIELNPFISGSSLQNLKIILKNDDNSIQSSELPKQNFQLIRGKAPLEESQFEEMNKANFVFSPKQNIISLIEFKPQVNYDGGTISLAQSKNLSTIDKAELIEKVVTFYKNYGEIINSGNTEEYKKLFKNAHNREIISMYYNSQEANKMIEKLSNRISESKGGLQPLENFDLYIHPNNKIVELLNKEGKSPLYSKINGKIRRFGVFLHIPATSNNLTIY